MTKCVSITFALLLLSGCREATTPPDLGHESIGGEYLVPREDLPPKIIALAESLERLPRNVSRDEFEAALAASGLKREPEWYKDFQHLWYLDADLNSETIRENSKYVISIGYFPKEDSTIVTYDAGIHHTYNDIPWRGTIWKIEWPLESSR
jgi:hypothetical protein